VRFPRAVFGPVERRAFLRLAWILRSDTCRLRAEFSGDGGVEKLFEGFVRDIQEFSRATELRCPALLYTIHGVSTAGVSLRRSQPFPVFQRRTFTYIVGCGRVAGRHLGRNTLGSTTKVTHASGRVRAGRMEVTQSSRPCLA